MRYKEHNYKNQNPPQAMRKVVRSSGQLEPLVMLRLRCLSKTSFIL
jgi:hypothetical protein